jgi:alpha-glucosidase
MCGEAAFEINHLSGDFWRISNTALPPECRANPFNKHYTCLDKELPRIAFQHIERQKEKIVATSGEHSRLKMEVTCHPKLEFNFQDKKTGALLFGDSSLHLGKDGGFRLTQTMKYPTDIYGLGERTTFKKNGRKYSNWPTDVFGVFPHVYGADDDPLYKCFPFLLCSSTIDSAEEETEDSSKSTNVSPRRTKVFFGIFLDNHSFQEWDFKTNTMTIQAKEGPMSFYFFSADHPSDVISKYNLLTGYMPMPPIWALGFHQCRWSYHPGSRVKEIVEEFPKRLIPCDAVWMDIDYMDGFRCFTFDVENGFDPKELVKFAAEKGIRLVVILDPGIKVDETYHVYQQMILGNHFLTTSSTESTKRNEEKFVGQVWPGDCIFPDFTSSRTREWWGGLYKEMVQHGFEGFWNDMNEPALFASPNATMPDNVKSSIGMHPYFHNLYGMLMARATFEGVSKLAPQSRPFVLTRAGFAGVQKYAWSWTGDNYSTWEHLRLSIVSCLGLSLSGLSGIGVDIGGFANDCTPELFARWIELGAFLPFMRVHSAKNTKDQEPWSFGEEVESISKRFIELRYSLLPYIYTWTRHCSATGVPLMRSMFLEFPHDDYSYDSRWEDTQFFLGPSLLVAPQLFEGATHREVYFPPTTDGWFDYFTRQCISSGGGEVVTVSTPLSSLPLFVRGNTVIPTKRVQRNAIETMKDETYEFVCFGTDPNRCKGNLYVDDGLTQEYLDGVFKWHKLDQFGIVHD